MYNFVRRSYYRTNNMTPYKTIYGHGQGSLTAKKSKFISNSYPVKSKQEAEEIISTLRKKYFDATHNVFAYRVLEGGMVIERQSDDGEPGGTAGMPLLELLRGEELLNIIVVVTRYYGGTLLGTGGLVKAYGHCGKNSLEDIIEKKPYIYVSITSNYSLGGKIEYEILKHNHIIDNTIYTNNVEYLIYLEDYRWPPFEKIISNITGANAVVTVLGKVYGFIYKESFIKE